MRQAGRRLVLASASPRRLELLRLLGLSFEVIPSGIDEEHPPGFPPEEIVGGLARAKARQVLDLAPDALVLGADTIVVADDPTGMRAPVILGKPAGARDAADMLSALSGRRHRVVTGSAVAWRSVRTCTRAEAVTTWVRFRPLSDDEIARYVATGEPMDKAGAYAIQGGAAAFVERIEGDYFNVVGLSLASVRRLLRGLVSGVGPVPAVPPTPYPIAIRGRRGRPGPRG